ncbi:hypothetical protein B0T19DRAFT_398027 [Cercophora scortea]|uniref:Uncharacterized protein n=1 Tax=Cercophora scortea TaxID=314031 RepID=A0AAE0IW51_9PEZI|nr:hypothetical protein B0T19DRAFT_398027 [Cercophora scortea]
MIIFANQEMMNKLLVFLINRTDNVRSYRIFNHPIHRCFFLLTSSLDSSIKSIASLLLHDSIGTSPPTSTKSPSPLAYQPRVFCLADKHARRFLLPCLDINLAWQGSPSHTLPPFSAEFTASSSSSFMAQHLDNTHISSQLDHLTSRLGHCQPSHTSQLLFLQVQTTYRVFTSLPSPTQYVFQSDPLLGLLWHTHIFNFSCFLDFVNLRLPPRHIGRCHRSLPSHVVSTLDIFTYLGLPYIPCPPSSFPLESDDGFAWRRSISFLFSCFVGGMSGQAVMAVGCLAKRS